MFDIKDPKEEIIIKFDYSDLGDIVTNPAVTVRVVKGIDSNSSAILSGLPQVEGNLVLQKVIQGVNGCWYEFSCLADIGGSRSLIRAVLPVHSGCIDDT